MNNIWFTISGKGQLIDLIKDFACTNDSIIDLGSGDGCMTYRLRSKGYKYVIPVDVVDKSKCVHPQIYNGIDIPFVQSDIVICAFVLHHVSRQIELLKEIRRVTKKYFLLFEDIPETKYELELARRHSGSHWGECVHCFHNAREWKKIMSDIGFSLIYFESVHILPFADTPLWYPQRRGFFVFK